MAIHYRTVSNFNGFLIKVQEGNDGSRRVLVKDKTTKLEICVASWGEQLVVSGKGTFQQVTVADPKGSEFFNFSRRP